MSTSASYVHEQNGHELGSHPWWTSLWRYRYALHNLVLKDFRLRYRNMSLGVFWSVINPLVMLSVLLIVFTYIHPNQHVEFFPVFLLIGIIFYNIVAMTLPPSTSAIMVNADLVKKVIFPRVMIPLAMVLSQMIHVGIKFGILIVFLVIYSVPFGWTMLWIFPVIVTMLIFVTGMALACSALAIQYRDMLYLVESSLTISFWLTPIFYDLSQVKLNLARPLYWLYLMNPASGCIDSARRALLRGQHPDIEAFGMAIMASLVVFGVGLYIFNRKQKFFADDL